MRDSVPSARYSRVSNVLRLWSISLIPTYRVYRLYYIKTFTKITESKDDSAKTRGVGILYFLAVSVL